MTRSSPPSLQCVQCMPKCHAARDAQASESLPVPLEWMRSRTELLALGAAPSKKGTERKNKNKLGVEREVRRREGSDLDPRR